MISTLIKHSNTALIEDTTDISEFQSMNKVKFDYNVKVILIPTKNEYCEANIQELLWWDQESFNKFKNESYSEILALVRSIETLSIKEASKLLYQPGFSLCDISIHISQDVLDKVTHLFN